MLSSARVLGARAGSRFSAPLANKSSTRAITTLLDVISEQVPVRQQKLLALKKEFGSEKVADVTVDQIIGGARGVPCLLYETSLLDAEEGIRFRGYSIPECQEKLPNFKGTPGGGEPLPEGVLWLLLTGEIPTKAQVDWLTADLHARAPLPSHIEPLIRSLPKELHPMTQMSIALSACQTDSKFQKAYTDGVNKKELWKFCYEDAIDVVAKLPEICALIYRCTYADGVVKKDTSLDYSANYARMLGWNDAGFDELMRLYLSIHTDHEGGNASAHATHLVGSTLADPYIAYAAGLNALAGPLHGLANQEVLLWIQNLQAKFRSEGKEVNKTTIEQFAWDTLNSGKVIPGFGHAVLRKTDPRYMCQREFALKHMPNDDLFKIVDTIFQVMPDVLTKHGKTKNPYPNVDSHSGVLLWHYGFDEARYYTVLFGVSRAMGALSQVVWDRALGLPIERPKSVTSEWLENKFKGSK